MVDRDDDSNVPPLHFPVVIQTYKWYHHAVILIIITTPHPGRIRGHRASFHPSPTLPVPDDHHPLIQGEG